MGYARLSRDPSHSSPIADFIALGGAVPLRVLTVVSDALLFSQVRVVHGEAVSTSNLIAPPGLTADDHDKKEMTKKTTICHILRIYIYIQEPTVGYTVYRIIHGPPFHFFFFFLLTR